MCSRERVRSDFGLDGRTRRSTDALKSARTMFAGYEDHVDVQSGVGDDKVGRDLNVHRAGLALRPGFVADKSIDFSNLWAHGGFLPYGVARSPSGADQRRSTNMTSKFQ